MRPGVLMCVLLGAVNIPLALLNFSFHTPFNTAVGVFNACGALFCWGCAVAISRLR